MGTLIEGKSHFEIKWIDTLRQVQEKSLKDFFNNLKLLRTITASGFVLLIQSLCLSAVLVKHTTLKQASNYEHKNTAAVRSLCIHRHSAH